MDPKRVSDEEAFETQEAAEAPEHRQQQLYFRELFQLKVRCEYTRRYRDTLSTWVTRFAILRAVASSGSIAGWVIWREYAFVWAA
jgi:hypothetical protein